MNKITYFIILTSSFFLAACSTSNEPVILEAKQIAMTGEPSSTLELTLIKKDKKGQSFPSRHVFSIFLIATLWFCFWKPVGIFLFIAGVFLAIVRVIGGVHFVTDVCAGALLGVLAGLISNYVFLIC